MCGILGGWTQSKLPREAIDDALGRLRHRGPDDAGFHQSGPTFLAMRRLSIIDLKGGHQPIFNEDGSVAVVLNGEIYNYVELMRELSARGHVFRTASDTEVLAHLYEERGQEMVCELRGMFAFAIWDGRKQQLFVARDRFGKKPLYYTRTKEGGLIFASELKALKPLAAAAGQSWRIRDQAIYDYLSLSVVPQPETVYEGVRMLAPASRAMLLAPRISPEDNAVVCRRARSDALVGERSRPAATAQRRAARRFPFRRRRFLSSGV